MPITIGARRESDFTDPIGMLGDCHRRIEKFLHVLVRVSELSQGGPLSQEHRAAFDTALRYFREGAPRHTADEEESLFPRLRRMNDGRVSAVLARIESLEQDHVRADTLHKAADLLGQRWLADGNLPTADADRLQGILAELQSIYGQHIAAEDNDVFPTAAAALSDADREAIGSEMASRRGIR